MAEDALKPRRRRFWSEEIWRVEHQGAMTLKGRFYALLRVLALTLRGLLDSRATSRAAALSFSTLLSIGPLIAIGVLIAGAALDKNDPEVLARQVDKFIRFIAPQVNRLETLDTQQAGKTGLAVNPGVIDFINNSISGAHTAAAGTLSVVTLVAIVLMLFTSIEDAFNEIWGVRRGRTWLLRIMIYWTILTLGAILLFAAVGALSAAAFANFFHEQFLALHLGPRFESLAHFALPALSLLVIVGMLTLFYRYIPNTRVLWRSALVGALVVAVLLVGNNLLAFTYFRRIDLTRSLYGSLSFVPIFMLGLYVFWLIVLIGGQVSYAIQNARYLNGRAAWSQLTERDREDLTLIVLLALVRRFDASLPPAGLKDLSKVIRVPAQFLNEALNHLVDFGLVVVVPRSSPDGASDNAYQPARALNHLTLGDFKRSFEGHGVHAVVTGIEADDPLVSLYRQALDKTIQAPVFSAPLQTLMEQHPLPAKSDQAGPA